MLIQKTSQNPGKLNCFYVGSQTQFQVPHFGIQA